jgi:tetratricopeptide (TPR) repeat protein
MNCIARGLRAMGATDVSAKHRCLLATCIAGALIGAWMPATAQAASSQQRIQGRVFDATGNPVGDALVRLEQEGVASGAETKTDTAGVFVFSLVERGSYHLSAKKLEMRSRAVVVVVSPVETPKQIDLLLIFSSSDSAAASSKSNATSPSSTLSMEFADQPTFTVAGVTDWTAAGGHGSDSSLRTSEALTREALALPSNSEGVKTTASERGTRNAKDADEHRLAGERAEEQNDPLAAVREFEQAVRLDPSEQNYFSWGSELLLHRAVLQAREVFQKGSATYPNSVRMLTALGTALFAEARYDEAAQRLCEASDLNPADPEPYLFMGKVEMAAPSPLPCIAQMLARFAVLQPNNSQANYFAAMAIWKSQAQTPDPQSLQQVETLLTKAVELDGKYADAYLQLGILHASRRDFEKAIRFYIQAIGANPDLAEAHYRLGLAYDRTGEQEKARQEFQLHQEIRKRQASAIDRQRREVKQFLMGGQPTYPAVH